MKVFLTHAYYLNEDSREQLIMKPYVPLGILYIAAYLEKNNIQVTVFDTTFSTFENQCAELIKTPPRIIGIYVNLMTRLNVLRLIQFIKTEKILSGTKTILGGPEVKHSAENFLAAGADFVITGEGEETMYELSEAILKNHSDFSNIKSVVYANGREYVHNPERQNIRDINTLPFPAREKVDLQKYFDVWKKRHGQSAVSVSTMRGCPYTCKWCSRAVYGQSYRRRDAELVVQELQWIHENYQVDTVWFVDDVFTISHKWLGEFNVAVKALNISLKYECITRADRMNEEVIQLLKESGCYRVWIGAESGSQKIIDAMDRRVEVGQVRSMIHKTREAGLQAGTFIMVGYPGETEADLEETLQHLKLSDPDQYTITVAYPIRGTPLFEETKKDFINPPNWDKGSDRQIDFKRTYSRKYYDFAIRWMANEVALHKTRLNKGPFKKQVLHKLKSLAARGAMSIQKLQTLIKS